MSDDLTSTGVPPSDSCHDFRTGEPMAWKCNGCKEYSQYRIEYDNGEIPKDWEQNDRGLFCGECKYD